MNNFIITQLEKEKFIKEIGISAEFYKESAEQLACKAIKSEDQKDIQIAKIKVEKYEAQQELAQKIYSLIGRYLCQEL